MTTCTESSNNDAYALFGLVAEVGELADIVAKGIRKMALKADGNNIVQWGCNDDRMDEICGRGVKELGDVLWFVALIARRFGLTLDEVAQTNLDKLADRKKSGTIITHTDH